MPKPLPNAAQRVVLGALVIALAIFGVYLSIGGFSGNGSESPREPTKGSQEKDNKGSTPPSPIPTVSTKDMDVLDWLPFDEDEAKAAAATAQAFSSAYGSIDYGKPQSSYFNSLKYFAAKDYKKTLAQSSGAAALWGEKSKEGTDSEGRSKVESIRSFNDESIVFIVQAQSITEDSAGATEEIGEFAVTVVREGGEWKVYDFQPADAANLGDG